jgi:uncharacterized membrane protein
MSQQANIRDHAESAGRAAEQAATSPTMTKLARVGYTMRGVVYLLIGILAAQLAMGHGGKATDPQGALQTINAQPFGRVLLSIVTIGLFCFALWSLIQAIFDAEHKGKGAKGIIARIGYAVTGISYGLLAFGALGTVVNGSSGSNSTRSAQDGTAQLLQAPFGVALVILLGLIVFGLGAYCCYRAYSANFREHLVLYDLSARMSKGAIFLGRAGYAALGVVFMIVGAFLIVAALQHDPGSAKGLDSALQVVASQPFGPWLLGVVAIGLAAYGVYSFVEARYRRIRTR